VTDEPTAKAAQRRRRAATRATDPDAARPDAEASRFDADGVALAPTSAGRRPGLPARDRRATLPVEAVGEPSTTERDQATEALELAHRIVELAADRKAADIVLLSVAEMTTLTDYFVICSGGSDRQLGAVADGIVEGTKAQGVLPIGREGAADAHWLLIDYGSVIVHVMAWPERDFYALEKLWSEAPLLLRIQ